jgi:hypothetical protein
LITREITQASTSTTWGHFGCIFTPLKIAQRDFGVRFMCVKWRLDNGPCVTSVAKNKIRANMRMVMAMAMCGFMRG